MGERKNTPFDGRGRKMKRIISILIFLAFISVSHSLPYAEEHPNMYLNKEEIVGIKQYFGSEPWSSEYTKLMRSAAEALNQQALSVTFQGKTTHDYYTQKPYDWSNNMPSPCGSTHCDGIINPLADRGDYEAAIIFGRTVRTLGLAYAFTEDARYADKAIELINTWCLNPDTYMNPEVFGSQGIEQYITFPGAFYGADLIYDYPGWDPVEKQEFLDWVYDFANDASSLHYTNNWENWRQVFVSSAGALLHNQELMDNAFNNFKTDLTSHIDSSGRMSKELGRTKSLSYSTYALNAMTQVAEIARHQGSDLYNYAVGGRSLKTAWDYHARYVISPSSWPYQQISAYKGENTGLYELAHLRVQEYNNVLNKYRPIQETRTMGPVSLTHAFGAYDEELYVSKSGSDIFGEGTKEKPWFTIQHAIEAAQGAQSNPVTINAAAGTYNENIEMDDWESLEGGWNSDFSQHWDFEMDGIVPGVEFETIITGRGDGDVIVARGNSRITGLTILNVGNNNNGISCQGCNDLLIKYNKINGSVSAGINIFAGSAIIESNFIFNLDSGSAGIFLTTEEWTLISNNLIVNNKGDGIIANASDYDIINNSISGNDSWGIILWGISNVKNNIIAQNKGGISGQEGFTATAAYNNVWNNSSLGDYTFLPVPGTGELNEDPLFVDPANFDFHLQPASPSVDSGDPVSDYSREPQPNRERINMGAYGGTAEATITNICICDFDSDGDIDGTDMVFFLLNSTGVSLTEFAWEIGRTDCQ